MLTSPHTFTSFLPPHTTNILLEQHFRRRLLSQLSPNVCLLAQSANTTIEYLSPNFPENRYLTGNMRGVMIASSVLVSLIGLSTASVAGESSCSTFSIYCEDMVLDRASFVVVTQVRS